MTFSPGVAPVHCEVVGTTLSEELSSIPQTYCESPATGVSFKWTRNGDGTSDLLVVHEINGSPTTTPATMTDEAVYHVPSSDTPVLGQGQFAHMVYTGPEDFSVPAFRFSV